MHGGIAESIKVRDNSLAEMFNQNAAIPWPYPRLFSVKPCVPHGGMEYRATFSYPQITQIPQI